MYYGFISACSSNAAAVAGSILPFWANPSDTPLRKAHLGVTLIWSWDFGEGCDNSMGVAAGLKLWQLLCRDLQSEQLIHTHLSNNTDQYWGTSCPLCNYFYLINIIRSSNYPSPSFQFLTLFATCDLLILLLSFTAIIPFFYHCTNKTQKLVRQALSFLVSYQISK